MCVVSYLTNFDIKDLYLFQSLKALNNNDLIKNNLYLEK